MSRFIPWPQLRIDPEVFSLHSKPPHGGISGKHEGIDHFERLLLAGDKFVLHHQVRPYRIDRPVSQSRCIASRMDSRSPDGRTTLHTAFI
jgi:hypothetical protein